MAHFEHFRDALGIARNILANRLARLVDHAILERRTCAADRRKVEYRVTEKGAALLPTIVALRQWGDRWGARGPGTPALVDARDGLPVRPVAVQAADGRLLGLGDLRWDRHGPSSSGLTTSPPSASLKPPDFRLGVPPSTARSRPGATGGGTSAGSPSAAGRDRGR